MYEGRSVGVYGLGKSGISAANLFLELGAEVSLFDDRPDIARLEQLGLDRYLKPFFDSDLLYISSGLPLDHPARKSDAEKLGDLELIGALFKGRTIAVTGTKGKTTTCHLLEHMLREGGMRAHAHGEHAPAPLDGLLSWGRDELPVIEANHVMLDPELAPFPDFSPYIAVILNILDDHANMYSPDDYAQLKMNAAMNMGQDGYAIINGDDPRIQSRIGRIRANLVRIGFGPENDVRVTGDMLVSDNHSLPIKSIRLLGRHQLYPCMAAMAAAEILEADPYPITTFDGLEHRLQRIGRYAINDSKSTIPAATIAAIDAVSGMGKDIVLILGGYAKGTDFSVLRPKIGQVSSLYIYGTDAGMIQEKIGAGDAYHDLDEVMQAVGRSFDPGQLILFSPGCSSKDQYKNFEYRGRHFIESVRRYIPR